MLIRLHFVTQADEVWPLASCKLHLIELLNAGRGSFLLTHTVTLTSNSWCFRQRCFSDWTLTYLACRDSPMAWAKDTQLAPKQEDEAIYNHISRERLLVFKPLQCQFLSVSIFISLPDSAFWVSLPRRHLHSFLSHQAWGWARQWIILELEVLASYQNRSSDPPDFIPFMFLSHSMQTLTKLSSSTCKHTHILPLDENTHTHTHTQNPKGFTKKETGACEREATSFWVGSREFSVFWTMSV